MSERLYYQDAYITKFTARIVERLSVAGRPAVVLDGTYFYPAGGGQPCDLGTMGGVEVVDVIAREDDAAVLHLLADSVSGDEVTCCIDWPRRFDLMQQHTGQHILTQAFVQIAGAQTVGFHLSPDSVTIDLDRADITPATVVQVEDQVNQIIYDNRVVKARIVSTDEADGIRVRMMPDHLLTGGLRVIEVEGFDMTACGGTHVARTGEIGIIKIVKVENHRDGSRVEFVCGRRALRNYREKHAVLTQLSAELSVGYWEVGEALGRLREDVQQAQRALRAAGKQLAEYEAARLLAEAPLYDGIRLVKAAFDDRAIDEVRALASRLVQEESTLALVGTAGEKAQIVLARSADLPQDMNGALQAALSVLGNGRGGGRPEFCQGGGVRASLEQVQAALDTAGRVALTRDGH